MLITDWKLNKSKITHYRQCYSPDGELTTVCSIYDSNKHPYTTNCKKWYCEVFGLNGIFITFYDDDLSMAKLEADIKLAKMGFDIDMTDHLKA